MILKIFQTDFFHFLNTFRRINTFLVMHISTFFNADLVNFHVAAILRIKMIETIQKKWSDFKWSTLRRKISSGNGTFISPRMYKLNTEKNYFSHCHFSKIWIPTFERDLSQNVCEDPQRWDFVVESCKGAQNFRNDPYFAFRTE